MQPARTRPILGDFNLLASHARISAAPWLLKRQEFERFLCSAARGFGFKFKLGSVQHYLQLTAIDKVLYTARERRKHELRQAHVLLGRKFHAPSEHGKLA